MVDDALCKSLESNSEPEKILDQMDQKKVTRVYHGWPSIANFMNFMKVD